MKTKFFTLLFFLILQSNCIASVFRLNVETTIRNKIDQGLILSSEHHFSTKVLSGDQINEKLNENISIDLKLDTREAGERTFELKGKILYRGISLKNEFPLPKMKISINEVKSISLKLSEKKDVDLSFVLKKENFNEF